MKTYFYLWNDITDWVGPGARSICRTNLEIHSKIVCIYQGITSKSLEEKEMMQECKENLYFSPCFCFEISHQ